MADIDSGKSPPPSPTKPSKSPPQSPSKNGVEQSHDSQLSRPSLPVRSKQTGSSVEDDQPSPDSPRHIPKLQGDNSSNSSAELPVPDQAEGKNSPLPDDLELLAKLDAANKLLEADRKSCNSLGNPSPTPGHSRKGSSTSQISTNSVTSQQSSVQNAEEEPASSSSTTSTASVPSGGNLWEIWGKLVNDWDSAKKKPLFVKQLVRRGIPHHFRGLAWQLLLNVHNSPMKAMYVDYLRSPSPSEKMIRRDIARTFPEHDFFKEKDGLGQESLFNVMKAYSLHDREVGYCQGSGFIVGLLLMQMPEEETFAVLVKLMQDYRLRELFKPSMAELGLCMFKLECLIQDLLPDLYLHFQTQSFHTSMYASPWFLTLFATVLPLSLACRIMDLFINEGMDMIFRVSVAILKTSQEELLNMDMEAMLKFFQKDLSKKYDTDFERLLQEAYHIKYSAKKMKRLEKEYTALKSRENEDQIELRRLRTENRLLRQRIENLEKESASLADRLIQNQITRAQEAEETTALKNQLCSLKQKLSTSQKQLEEAQGLIGDIKERTNSITSASSLDEGEAQTVIQGLQEELIMVRLREAENQSKMKSLYDKISELEELNQRLQRAPSNDVQCLQEELIAVKLREAEANLSLKEMKQKITELDGMWEKHMSGTSSKENSPKDKNLKAEVKHLQEEVMTVKLREAARLSDLKETRQRVMELETQNQICTNQIRRMDEENKKHKAELATAADRERDLQNQIRDFLRKMDDLESKRKEESMMARIKEAETDQLIGELRQKIASLEIQKEELLTVDRLDSNDGTQDLENRIFDLQDEVLQLKLASPKGPGSLSPRITIKDEDDDDDDVDDSEDPESLNRTLSEIIEGTRSSTNLMALLKGDLNRDPRASSSPLLKKRTAENSPYMLRKCSEESSSQLQNLPEESSPVMRKLSEDNSCPESSAGITSERTGSNANSYSGTLKTENDISDVDSGCELPQPENTVFTKNSEESSAILMTKSSSLVNGETYSATDDISLAKTKSSSSGAKETDIHTASGSAVVNSHSSDHGSAVNNDTESSAKSEAGNISAADANVI